MISVPRAQRGPIDMHVHAVGNGLSGSGCWLSLKGYRMLAGQFMLKRIGLKNKLTDREFDSEYVAWLAGLVRDSKLSHAVVLAHEEVYHEDGTKKQFGTFHVSNRHVLATARLHPELLPAVSIHPARKDACQELAACAEAGAVMVKILPPSQNIDCSRPAYREFFQLMAELKLPLLSHTGGEYTVPVVDKRLFSPLLLRQPLDLGVRVIAAHFATRSAPPFLERNYLPAFLEMLKEYPHLYGDNSALNTPNRSHGLKTAMGEAARDRCVHGSDYPVPVSGKWAKLRGLITSQEEKQAASIPNILERDRMLKEAMGFAPEVFTRVWDILRVGDAE